MGAEIDEKCEHFKNKSGNVGMEELSERAGSAVGPSFVKNGTRVYGCGNHERWSPPLVLADGNTWGRCGCSRHCGRAKMEDVICGVNIYCSGGGEPDLKHPTQGKRNED